MKFKLSRHNTVNDVDQMKGIITKTENSPIRNSIIIITFVLFDILIEH